MGKLKAFEIFLLNPGGVVEAGGILNGQLVIENLEDMEVREITVQCFGKCRVQWLDSHGNSPLTEFQVGVGSATSGEEIYINEAKVCFPSNYQSEEDLLETRTFPKGDHLYNFHFHIPEHVPSSMSTEMGYVRYMLRAIIDRPCKVENNTRVFTVISHHDLNTVTNVERPVQSKGAMEIGSLLRRPGFCKASVRLPKRGYVPGETIPVDIQVCNDTCQDIKKAYLCLKMVTDYRVMSQKFTAEQVLSKSCLDKILAGQTLEETNRDLVIPKDTPPSHLRGCSLMHVRYVVELNVKMSFLSLKKLKTRVKLEVGTVEANTETIRAYNMVFEPPPNYHDLPPSYNDAITKYITSECHHDTSAPPSYESLSDETDEEIPIRTRLILAPTLSQDSPSEQGSENTNSSSSSGSIERRSRADVMCLGFSDVVGEIAPFTSCLPLLPCTFWWGECI